jgi:hypothetical protein
MKAAGYALGTTRVYARTKIESPLFVKRRRRRRGAGLSRGTPPAAPDS